MRRLFLAFMLLLVSGTAHAAGPAPAATPQTAEQAQATGHRPVPTGFFGFLPLVRLKGPPVACSAALDGALALTSAYALCVCKGDAAAWVKQSDPASSCNWQAAREPRH
jgi:hypothetical protein